MNVFYHLYLQDCTVAPVVANFTPVQKRTKQLRSSMLGAANAEQELNDDEATEEITVVPAPEKLYAVSAATPEGYYIVKCLKVINSHSFLGMYLSRVSGSEDLDNIVFKESRNKDHFEFATIVCEVNFLLRPSNAKYNLLYVNKTELNNVIETIDEIYGD